MKTTAIIINLIISVAVWIDSNREIKKNPVLQAYYEAMSGTTKILSWVLVIISSLTIYGLILYGTGFWNTIGWFFIVSDTITMIILNIVLRALNR